VIPSIIQDLFINHWVRTSILLLFAGTLLYKTFRSLRAHRLKERYVLVFLLTSLPFLVLAFVPNGIVFLSEEMDIEKPTLMIMGLAGFLILLIFELLSIVSQQDRKISALAQVVALLMEREKMVERGGEAEKRPSELSNKSQTGILEAGNSNQIPNSNDPIIK
jgi:hypothetical protein